MIGVFDSGVGGLSVWSELEKLIPNQKYVYFSDNAYCPYGTKDPDEIIERSIKISKFLIEKGASLIVVACNTATAASIKVLRQKFSIPFVGIEPAIKPAALTSETGVVGVMATRNTLKGRLYQDTLDKFATNVQVIDRVGVGLVETVEKGILEGDDVEKLVHNVVDEMLANNVDSIVLGCTHYPFLVNTIRKIVGDNIHIINPAPAIAQRVEFILNEKNLTDLDKNNGTDFYSSGDDATLRRLVPIISKKQLKYLYNLTNL